MAEEKKLAAPTQSVIRFVKPIEKINRNVTGDNWCTSVELALELKKRGLTYLRTMNKNKRHIPPSFLSHKCREINSSLYGFTKELTLSACVLKKSKVALMLSSMHKTASDDEDGKPAMISDYRISKGGVDSLDRKCANYSKNNTLAHDSVCFSIFAMVNVSGK